MARSKNTLALLVKLLHNCLGLLTFLWGMIALLYGYQFMIIEQNSKLSERQFLWTGTIATIIFTICGGIWSYFESATENKTYTT